MLGEDTAETKPKIEGGGDEVLSIKVKDQQGGEVCVSRRCIEWWLKHHLFSVGCVQSKKVDQV